MSIWYLLNAILIWFAVTYFFLNGLLGGIIMAMPSQLQLEIWPIEFQNQQALPIKSHAFWPVGWETTSYLWIHAKDPNPSSGADWYLFKVRVSSFCVDKGVRIRNPWTTLTSRRACQSRWSCEIAWCGDRRRVPSSIWCPQVSALNSGLWTQPANQRWSQSQFQPMRE